MIDLIYKTLLTILNKENQGNVTPTEFNLIAHNIQSEIFREYFEDENRDKIKENRGFSNKGFSNLVYHQRQKIDQFAENEDVSVVGGIFTLPENLYYVEDDGIITNSSNTPKGRVVEEVEKGKINYLNLSLAKPTETYPIYSNYGKYIKVYPTTIDEIQIAYLRTPKVPNWTYFTTTVGGDPLFNPADEDFQDFELHNSEFSNIVMRMLSLFGITLREADIVQIAEMIKDKINTKDNS